MGWSARRNSCEPQLSSLRTVLLRRQDAGPRASILEVSLVPHGLFQAALLHKRLQDAKEALRFQLAEVP